MNGGDDPRGLDLPFRQSGLNLRPSSSSVTRNQLGGNVISTELNFNQNPNIPVIQPINTGVQKTSTTTDIRCQNYCGVSGLSSISDCGTTDPDQSQALLIVEFRRVKLAYLPQLVKWLKIMERKYSQVQTVSESDNLKKHMVSVRKMIRLLSIAENQLMVFNMQKLRHNMNTVIEYYNKFVKNAHQFSSPQTMVACTNVTAAPVLMNQPVISSSTINPGFSSGYAISTEPANMKSNTRTTNSVTQSISQPGKRKKSSNDDATCRASKKPRSRNSYESWLDLATLRSSKRSSIPAKLCQASTPSTAMTPSCESNGKIENIKRQPVSEGPVAIVGAPEISLDSPIDGLLDVVKSPMLVNAANDMNTASIEMDKLPDFAFDDEPAFGVDLAEFVQSMDYDEELFKRLESDIESVNNSAVQQSSKLDLLDEIKDANQNLSGTVIEILDESSNQSNGTIVRCTYSYSPGAGSADKLRSMFGCESMNLSVEFLVPSEYPTLPPKTVLDCRPRDSGIATEMTEVAKLMLGSLLRISNSSRVSEMAQVWDRCAQSAVLTYEKLLVAETSAPKMVWDSVGQTHNQICNKTCTV